MPNTVDFYLSKGFDRPMAEYFARGRKRLAAVEPHPDYTMTVTFRNGEKRLYDMRPWIESEKYGRVYAPLKDIDFFMRAYVDGSAAWSDEIDIAPEELYDNGVPIDETAYGSKEKNGESENEQN